MTRFYVYLGGAVQGPFTPEEVRALPSFSPELPVCLDDGRGEWKSPGDVPELAHGSEDPATSSTHGHDLTVLPCSDCGAPVSFPKHAATATCEYCSTTFQPDLEKAVLLKLDCLRCGAELNLEEAMEAIVCGACSHRSFVTSENRVRRYLALRTASDEEASAIYARRGETVARFITVLVPVWRLRYAEHSYEKFIVRRDRRTDFFGDENAIRFLGAFFDRELNWESFDVEPFDSSSLPPETNLLPAAWDGLSDRERPGLFRVKIGRRASLIHYPVLLAMLEGGEKLSNLIFDPVLNRTIPFRGTGGGPKPAEPSPHVERILLVSAECPSCAAPFPSKADERVHVCPDCSAAFAPEGRILRSVPSAVIEASVPDLRTTGYLPYWEFDFGIPGLEERLDGHPHAESLRHLGGKSRVRLPAFLFRGPNALFEKFDALAARLFREDPDLAANPGAVVPAEPIVTDAEEPRSMVGGAILSFFDSKEFRLAAYQPGFLDEIGRFVSETGFEMANPRLLFIPIEAEEGRIREGIFGMTLERKALGF